MQEVVAEAAAFGHAIGRELRTVATDPRRLADLLGATLAISPLPFTGSSLAAAAPQPLTAGQLAPASGSRQPLSAMLGEAFPPQAAADRLDPARARSPVTGNPDGNESWRLSGPLFVDGPSARDVFQGGIGDCYIAASASAFASARPQDITKLFTPNDDGTVTVRLYQLNREGGYDAVDIVVDTDFYLTLSGTMAYGRSDANGTALTPELWWPLVEKAFAIKHGASYEFLNRGGNPGLALAEITGFKTDSHVISLRGEGAMQRDLLEATANQVPVVAWTSDVLPPGAKPGVRANHAFAVLGTHRDQTGQVFVVLRDPNGTGEPVGDGVNDGEFMLTLAEFRDGFHAYAISRSAADDDASNRGRVLLGTFSAGTIMFLVGRRIRSADANRR